MTSARGYIERLGPYQSLLLLSIPTGLVEPLKLIAVAVAGEGHWITGTVMIIVAYGFSLLFVERLFQIVKPKLLSLPWFARLWNWVLVVRDKVVGLELRPTAWVEPNSIVLLTFSTQPPDLTFHEHR
jgi:hypothetical protein